MVRVSYKDNDMFDRDMRVVYSVKTTTFPRNIAFSEDGYLGVAVQPKCAYIFDQNGKLVEKHCCKSLFCDIFNVSYCCSKFGFIFNEYVAIYDVSSGTWDILRIEGTNTYAGGITMLKDGFLVGWIHLAYFDFNGNRRWFIASPRVEHLNNGPAVYKNEYVYVPRYDYPYSDDPIQIKGALTILKFSDCCYGKTIEIPDFVWDAKVCDHYLAVGSARRIYFTDISDPESPKLLWKFDKIATDSPSFRSLGAHRLAFSPDCKYLASVNFEDKKVHIFKVPSGKEAIELEFESHVLAVDWWKDRIAVSLKNGTIYVLKPISLAERFSELVKYTDNILLSRNRELVPLQMQMDL